jgi:hypothetical protein
VSCPRLSFGADKHSSSLLVAGPECSISSKQQGLMCHPDRAPHAVAGAESNGLERFSAAARQVALLPLTLVASPPTEAAKQSLAAGMDLAAGAAAAASVVQAKQRQQPPESSDGGAADTHPAAQQPQRDASGPPSQPATAAGAAAAADEAALQSPSQAAKPAAVTPPPTTAQPAGQAELPGGSAGAAVAQVLCLCELSAVICI